MTKLLAQHGPAKGKKITDSLNKDNLSGAIFSLNDETFSSINSYVDNTAKLNKHNTYLDPQFYYSTFDSIILKKLSDIDEYPSNITRRDWRKHSSKISDYLNYHIDSTREISTTLITPGFYIDNINWHFDYSIDIFNYCVKKYKFEHYALSLLVHYSFFNNKANVDEMIEELNDMCEHKDFIYFTLCHDKNIDNNYEDMDANCLANVLYMVHHLQKAGFQFIIGYSFMNSILYSMLGCDFVASGWFNTLRKFQKNRFEMTDSFGRRKKRYTSIPLLTYIMLDDIQIMLETNKIKTSDILSNTDCDTNFTTDGNSLSFVDLEHQYWESLTSVFDTIESSGNLKKRILVLKKMISDALSLYKKVIDELDTQGLNEESKRIKNASKHLITWSASIDIFQENAMIL